MTCLISICFTAVLFIKHTVTYVHTVMNTSGFRDQPAS